MFFFGNPEDTAQLYWRGATEATGPALADAPLDEMSEQELRIALTYARMAYKAGAKDGASDDVMEVLLREHDAVFVALAEISEKFRSYVKAGACLPLTGFSAESIAKYKNLAGVGD